MEFIRYQKEQVKKAKTRKGRKELISEAGMALTDDELEMVAGGMIVDDRIADGIICERCGKKFWFESKYKKHLEDCTG